MESVPQRVGIRTLLADLVGKAMNLPTPPGQNPEDQWLNSVLRLRRELRFETRTQQNKTFVVVEDSVRNKFFQIGLREFKLISNVDGKRSMAEIIHQLGPDEFDNSFAAKVSQWLIQSNLAYCDKMDSSQRINAQVQSIEKANLIAKLNPVSFKIKLFNPTGAINAIFPVAKLAFTKHFSRSGASSPSLA